MKKVFSTVVLAIAMMACTATTNAQQKLAHINSEEVMSMMPEYQTAAKDLEAYVKSFEEMFNKKKKDFQVKYEEYVKVEKTLTETMKEIKQMELKNMDEDIQKFQQEAQEKVEAKKNTLLKPVTVKLENAIKEVAKANGIDYVFDLVSTGLIVYPASDDMLPLLKAKLNLKEPVAAAPKAAAGGAKPAGQAPKR
jgi:outer membrane protein